MNTDEIDAPRQSLTPFDLEQMSVAELGDYIANLNAEIARAEKMIAKKQAHKSGVEGLFKK